MLVAPVGVSGLVDTPPSPAPRSRPPPLPHQSPEPGASPSSAMKKSASDSQVAGDSPGTNTPGSRRSSNPILGSVKPKVGNLLTVLLHCLSY